MNKFFVVLIGFVFFSIQLFGSESGDTLKSSFLDAYYNKNNKSDYQYLLQSGFRQLENDSLDEGLQNILNGLTKLNEEEQTNRFAEYEYLELYYLLSLINSSDIIPEDIALLKKYFHRVFVPESVYKKPALKTLLAEMKNAKLLNRIFIFDEAIHNNIIRAVSQTYQFQQKYPNTLEHNAFLGKRFYNIGIWLLSKEHLSKAIDAFPSYALGYAYRGVCNMNLNMPDEAKKDFETSIRLYSKNPMAYNELGRYYLYVGDPKMAIPQFYNAIKANPVYVPPYNNIGVSYYQLNELDSALKYYNQTIEYQPKYILAYNNRAQLFYDHEQYEKAIFDYTKSIDLNKGNPEVYAQRGLSYYLIGSFDKALADFTLAARLKPYNSYYNDLIGQCYVAKDELKKAIKVYSKSIRLNNKKENAFFERGNCYFKLKKYKEAVTDYSSCIALNESNPQSFLARGDAYLRLKEYQLALNDYTMALNTNNLDVVSIDKIGFVYHAMDDFDKSNEYYNQILQMDSLSYSAYFMRGMNYFYMEQYDRALEDLFKSLEVNPDYSLSICQIGWIYYKKGDFNKCIEYSNRAYLLDKELINTQFNIALSYLRLGEKEKACQLYEATNKANKKNTYYIDGAKKNLQELVDKKICEEDAKYILKEIF